MIRITGMNSGLDTDAIIQELVSANSVKKEKLEKEQTKHEWKQTAWVDLNKKIKNFYSTSLSNLRFSSSFNKKKTTSSNSNVATVTAGDSAVNGSQSLIVKSLARSGYLTGGKLSENGSVNRNTTLNTLNSDIASGDTASFSVTVGGKTTQIDLSGASKVGDVISKLQNAGLNASFDQTNQRIFLSVEDSGAANDFKLNANNVSGLKALASLGLLTAEELSKNAGANSELAAMYDEATGALKNTDEANAYVTKKATSYAAVLQNSVPSVDTVQGYYNKIDELKKDWEDNGKVAYDSAVATYGTKEKVEELQTEVKEKLEYLELLEKEAALGADESLSEEDAKKLQEYREKYVDAGDPPSFTKEELNTTKTELETAAKQFASYESLQSAIEAQENNILAAAKNAKILNDYYADAYADKLSAISGATYAEKLDSINLAISEESAKSADEMDADKLKELETQKKMLQTMVDNEAIYSGSVPTDKGVSYDAATEGIQNRAINTVTQEAQAAYEMSDPDKVNAYLSGTNNAVRVLGADAVIELNGAEFTSSSNSFSVNGLTITAKATSNVTGTDVNGDPIYEETQINTENDIDGVYNVIKNFLKGYNDLIKEIDTLYNAESAKDYNPLTPEEKDAMTDDEVEKWEKKIKDALLRHDSDLGDVQTMLKTAMLGSYTINGTKYSLASFGISTQGYFNSADNEKGVYHIDGDASDTVTGGEKDKLKTMIASDPDAVSSFFMQLATDMYDKLQKASQTSTNRTFGNFYDDKVLTKQYSDYKTKISKQQDKLNAMEDKYYREFAAMEKALSQINSTSSYISSMFGM